MWGKKKKEEPCKAEVLMKEVLVQLEQHKVYGEVLKEVINRQERRINDLLDRFMARTFPELKTYETEEAFMPTPQNPLEDLQDLGLTEDMAGEILDVPEDELPKP